MTKWDFFLPGMQGWFNIQITIYVIHHQRVWNAVLGCSLKNNRMIYVCFQGKPFNIIVIQVYAPTSNAGEVEWFYEDLQDLLELIPEKMPLSLNRDGMQK